MSAAPMPRSSPRARGWLGWPLRVADRVRWLWLRALGPLAKPLVRDRELRVAVAGTSMIALALVAAVLVPMWLLALGPIVWGVPHVLGDVRYLWVRPGLHRRWTPWLLVAAPLVGLSVTADPVWGFVAVGGAALAARGAWWKKAPVLAAAAGLLFVAHRHAFWTAVIFAHAHNFVGVALWWVWRRRMGRLHWIPLVAFLGASALLTTGLLDGLVHGAGALAAGPGGMDVYYHLGSLAPDVPGMLAVRLVLLFAFAQSVHYAVWVRLVPEEDRRRETPRTFAATFRALAADFGRPLVALVVLAAVALGVWGALDVFAARTGYLRAVLFHGYFEVAVAALLLVEGGRPRARTADAPA
ncbi:MAG TPA: hypothetical protein RMH99_09135 [Sandaracinaceae bacterium LLY-WYZ-13_1]|nr:hypothetical protein [Sandaracinaceae bacterium LLY-WYZ-13_1]